MTKNSIAEEKPTGPTGVWRITEWVGIAFYALLVFQYLSLWIAPGQNDGVKIHGLTWLFLFEFVLAHSGIFMAVFPRKTALFIFVPFYGLFALAFNAAVPGNTILFLYCGVILMRMRFIFSDPSSPARGRALTLSILSAVLFFLCTVVIFSAAGILPKLGLTEGYLASIDFANLSDSSGDFVDNPHAAMATGAVYFTLLAMTEIRLFGLLKTRGSAQRDETL